MKKIKINEKETIAYRELGEGKNLLLLHGNLSSSFFMEHIMESLSESFYVVAPDMRGFGESTYEQEADDVRSYAEDMVAFMDLMEMEEAYVLGWSFGGAVTMEMCRMVGERIPKAFLLSSVGIRGTNFQGIQEILSDLEEQAKNVVESPLDYVKNRLGELAHRFREGQEDKEKQEELKAEILWEKYRGESPEGEDKKQYLLEIMKQRNLLEIARSLIRYNISPEKILGIQGDNGIVEIHQPICICHGEDDLVIPIEEIEYIAQCLGEKATFERVGETGHFMLLDKPEKVVSCIKEFFEA